MSSKSLPSVGVSFHLLVDAVDMLGAARYLGAQAHPLELLLQNLDYLGDEVLALGAAGGNQAGHVAVLFRLQVAEGQVLQLPLQLPYPQAVGEGGIDFQRLLGDAALPLRRQRPQRAHIVQAVGQLDKDHPQVFRHRHQHFSQVFRLPGPVGGAGGMQGELAQLGGAINQLGDLGAEPGFDLGRGVRRSFRGHRGAEPPPACWRRTGGSARMSATCSGCSI